MKYIYLRMTVKDYRERRETNKDLAYNKDPYFEEAVLHMSSEIGRVHSQYKFPEKQIVISFLCVLSDALPKFVGNICS